MSRSRFQPRLMATSFVRAEDEEQEDDGFIKAMEDEIKKNGGAAKASDLEFSYLFPDNPFKVIVANEVAELLISTLFAISGAFTHPKNLSLVLRNVSLLCFNIPPFPLSPSKEATVPFRFRSELEAQDIGLLVHIDYFDNEEHPHRAIAFQDYVKITSSDSYFDIQGLSLIAAVIGAVYFTINFVYSAAPEAAGTKKTRPNKAAIQEEIEAKKDVLAEEWIPRAP
ncbi:hypothetical protein BC829DRAFT_397836 [Chytridium lagenaria]|nr:hypothetical protein BC829DRAFT_397836 [Chytridium lagenaria]